MNLHRVGSNIAWLIGNRIVTKAATLFTLGYVARHLGTSHYGVLSYALLLVGMFHAIANMGLDGVVIRELVQRPDQDRYILGSCLFLRICGAFVAFALVLGSALLDPINHELMSVFVCVACMFFPQALEVADLWFQTNIESKYPVMGRTAAVVIASGIKIGLVIAEAPLLTFALAWFTESALNAIAVLWVYKWRGKSALSWRLDLQLAGRLFRDSWPLVLSGLLIALYMRLEQLMVRNLLGYEHLGVYNAASNITETWSFLPAFILSSIYPILVQMRKDTPDLFPARMQLVFDLLTGAGFLIAIALAVLAPWIVPFLFGDRFTMAIPVLILQSLGAPIFFSGAVRAQFFLFENINIYHTLTATLGIALNITMALVLIPKWGLPGAALSGLLGASLAGFGSSWIFRPIRPCAKWQLKSFLLIFRLKSFIRTLKDFLHIARSSSHN